MCTIDADFWHHRHGATFVGRSCWNGWDLRTCKDEPCTLYERERVCLCVLYCRWNDTQPTDSFCALVAFICFRKTFCSCCCSRLYVCIHAAKNFQQFSTFDICACMCVCVRDGKVNMHVFAVLLFAFDENWWHSSSFRSFTMCCRQSARE